MKQRLGQHLYWLIAPHYFTRWGRVLDRLFGRIFRGYSFKVFKPEWLQAAVSADVKPLFPVVPERVGLAAVLDDSDFRKGMASYAASLDGAEKG